MGFQRQKWCPGRLSGRWWFVLDRKIVHQLWGLSKKKKRKEKSSTTFEVSWNMATLLIGSFLQWHLTLFQLFSISADHSCNTNLKFLRHFYQIFRQAGAWDSSSLEWLVHNNYITAGERHKCQVKTLCHKHTAWPPTFQKWEVGHYCILVTHPILTQALLPIAHCWRLFLVSCISVFKACECLMFNLTMDVVLFSIA